MLETAHAKARKAGTKTDRPALEFRVMEHQLRVIFPQELLLLLDASGFRVETRWRESGAWQKW